MIKTIIRKTNVTYCAFCKRPTIAEDKFREDNPDTEQKFDGIPGYMIKSIADKDEYNKYSMWDTGVCSHCIDAINKIVPVINKNNLDSASVTETLQGGNNNGKNL